MTFQTVIVAFVLIASLAYACYWGYKVWNKAANPCAGCEGCALKDMKNQCEQKKKGKMFGRIK